MFSGVVLGSTELNNKAHMKDNLRMRFFSFAGGDGALFYSIWQFWFPDVTVTCGDRVNDITRRCTFNREESRIP